MIKRCWVSFGRFVGSWGIVDPIWGRLGEPRREKGDEQKVTNKTREKDREDKRKKSRHRALLGAILVVLGGLGRSLEGSWMVVGASWRGSGWSWGRLGSVLGRLGRHRSF